MLKPTDCYKHFRSLFDIYTKADRQQLDETYDTEVSSNYKNQRETVSVEVSSNYKNERETVSVEVSPGRGVPQGSVFPDK